jgi:hypothetical protein
MKSSRTVLVALTLSGTLAVTAACGSSSGNSAAGGGASASPAADPLVVLTASITKAKGTSSKFTLSGQVGPVTTDGSGLMDTATRSESVTLTVTTPAKAIHEQVTMVGTDIYLKMDLPIPSIEAGKWMHVDITRLKSLASLGLGDPSDPTNLSTYAKEIVTVQQTSPGQYQGTLDITKAPLPSLTAALLAQAGDALKSVPFTATTDDQGRLTSMTVQMPSLGAGIPPSTTKVGFSDFGTPVNVQAPPAAQTQEAPDMLYQVLGG